MAARESIGRQRDNRQRLSNWSNGDCFHIARSKTLQNDSRHGQLGDPDRSKPQEPMDRSDATLANFVCSLAGRYCQCTQTVLLSAPFRPVYICPASPITYGSANTRRLTNSVHGQGIAAQLTPYPVRVTLYDIKLNFAEIGPVPENCASALSRLQSTLPAASLSFRKLIPNLLD